MPPIPSPIAIVCLLRGIVWSLALRKPVRGHRFVEAEKAAGQPSCVHVLECRDCGTVSVGWETCSRCHDRTRARSSDGIREPL